MGIKIQIVLETEEVDPVTLAPVKLILGWAELDPLAVGRSQAGVLECMAQVPGVLHQIADQLESGMTVGPDEATWLAGDPDVT